MTFSVESPASALRLLNILFRRLPGKVLEKFQIFSDMTPDYVGFQTPRGHTGNAYGKRRSRVKTVAPVAHAR
jgi:hypothetical protein